MNRTTASILFISLAAGVAVAYPQHARRGAPPPSRIDVPPAGLTLPMRDFGGRPLVDVRINDQGPYSFVFDTGAGISVISESVGRELSLSPAAGVQARSPGGGAAPPTIVMVNTLGVGTATLGGLMAAVMPLEELLKGDGAPRGVLSASSFRGCLVVLDYPGKRITIKPGALEAADSKTIFEYGEDQALPLVPVRIAGHDTYVHLDTGSVYTLTLPRHFLAELPLKTQPKDAGMARLLTGTSPVSTAAVDGPIQLGQYPLDLREVRFSDMRLGGEVGPGNIGSEVLKDFVVTLDSKNRRVRLVR
jgi:hypothetical protein